MRLFRNTIEAARELASHLSYLKSEDPIILGLADGGVPLAEIIARELDAPLDVLLIERLSAPTAPDHIVGAVDEHGRISMIQTTARWHHLTSQQMVEPARDAFRDLQRRRGEIRSLLPELDVIGRTVIVVGHGIATGAKMLGAISSVKDRGATSVVAAAPAGHSKATWRLHDSADVVVIPHRPSEFKGVDHFYEQHTPTSPGTTMSVVRRWVKSRPALDAAARTFVLKTTNSLDQLIVAEVDLPANMHRGDEPRPAVIFAHGFDSDAKSVRNVDISQRLAKRGVVGVRLNFTGHGRSEGSPEQATDQQMLDDLRRICQQTAELHEVDAHRIGLCGSGSGGMIALYSAATEPMIGALVIRGPVCGKEIEAAHRVQAATLLIHAERDTALRDAVETLDRELAATHKLLRIPNSSRMFSDPISRELMVSATVDWFIDHLIPVAVPEDQVENAGASEAGQN